MSYSASSYNYATPLSSSDRLSSPTSMQLVDGRAIHSTFTGSIDENNIVTVSGSNTDTAEKYINYFILRSAHLKPSTQYYVVFELFDYSGSFALMKLTNDDTGDSQISTNVQFGMSEMRRGVSVYPVVTRASVEQTISLRSYVRINTGQSFTMKYRLSLLPYAPDPAAFVYSKYSPTVYPLDTKFFELSNNTLDGSFYPVVGDAGIWSAAAPTQSNPFIITITADAPSSANAIRLISSKYCYPVDFTIRLYDSNDSLVKSIVVTGNDSAVYVAHFNTVTVQRYSVEIRSASRANSAVPIYVVDTPGEVIRADALKLKHSESSSLSSRIDLYKTDSIKIKQSNVAAPKQLTVHSGDVLPVRNSAARTFSAKVAATDALHAKLRSTTAIRNSFSASDALKVSQRNGSHVQNDIGVSSKLLDVAVIRESEGLHITNTIRAADTLKLRTDDEGTLTNIHSVMKAPSRRVYGKVRITYTDPLTNDVITDVRTNSEAYNSERMQLTDGSSITDSLFFTLYDNDLSGRYAVSSASSQVGWTSKVLSDANGSFSVAPYVLLTFAPRPLSDLSIIFDESHGSLARDFTVDIATDDEQEVSFAFVDNTNTEVIVLSSAVPEAVSVKITVTKVSKAYSPVTVLSIPVLSTFLYTGYQDRSELINMSVLEELTYEDDIEALGGVSANEVRISLDNSSRVFNFDNIASHVSKQLKRNRKIEPYLGAEVVPGEIEWYKLGIFWSYNWEVPYNSLIANVTGFDTIGLLGTTTFAYHYTQVNKSIGQLVDYVLTDAKKLFTFLKWTVDAELYDIIIPYAWFDYSSHAAALRKISMAYPMHIYCDREGCICVAPQKLHLDYYYDKWSDSTNVIDKVYNSLYTVLPNVINVKVISPVLTPGAALVTDSLAFNVASIPTRTLNFGSPYISDINITVDKDETVQYTYEVYSWGVELFFTGSGVVRSIECTGTTIDITNTSVVSHRDNDSIAVNGMVTRDISSSFIQTSDLASILINRLLELSENDKYDVEVTYRGDIALTINDPILLLDSLATDNRYNIKRQELTWDGSLSGTANLNT